ncbi:MAG: hypothetical protein AAGA58_18570, partial [Verrucomicrobiota bacterium]
VFPRLKDSQVVIKVQELRDHEKKQIVYNHLKLGNQEKKFVRSLKPHLDDFSLNPSFLPETARRLGLAIFTKSLSVTSEGLRDYVEKPTEFLEDVITGLRTSDRAALSLLFIRGGYFDAPWKPTIDDRETLERLGAGIGETRESFSSLEITFISKEIESGQTRFKFIHPTIGDCFGTLVGKDPNLLDVYLKGTRPEMLWDEITCGDVSLEGANIVVPESYFGVILEKIEQDLQEADSQRRVLDFLESRCNLEFLRIFVSKNGEFLDGLRFHKWIMWDENSSFVAELHRKGILPESTRKRFVEYCHNSALHWRDWTFLRSEKLRKVFRPSELRSVRATIRKYITSKEVSRWIRAEESSFVDSDSSDPHEHFWELRTSVEILIREFRKDKALRTKFNNSFQRIERSIESLEADEAEWSEDLGESEEEESSIENARSVFDDVDI